MWTHACIYSSQALDLVQSEPDKAMTPYIQLVKFEAYIQNKSNEDERYKDLLHHLHKSQLRLKEELDAVLIK